jgi:AcrR family transcriptional regulator
VTAIAADAGVAVQTIYNTVGSKAAVLSLVLDTAAAGPDAPQAVRERMQQRAAHKATPEALIELLATWFAEVHPRIAPILRVITEAGGFDPEIAELGTRRARQRFENYHLAARELADRQALREGTSIEQAAATIWALGHPDVYQLLVIDQRWPTATYTTWLERQLGAALLPST